ncbi:MAG: hypothetical protein E6R13_01980 [Spirochaetes bacterium]|nr:MAG: hypothetical protein E6R13_01980 [Spirochaetota bacterium]
MKEYFIQFALIQEPERNYCAKLSKREFGKGKLTADLIRSVFYNKIKQTIKETCGWDISDENIIIYDIISFD